MLISTKIHPPQLKSNIMYRKGLVDHLKNADKCRLILITGPAGYGKTSLTGQWIERENPAVAWYSIDETDNDFDIFFRYFLSALVEAENGIEPILGPLLQDQSRLSAEDVIPTLIHALNAISYDIYVVLDDYHVIDVDDIHKALARVMKYLPAKVHVVIISRHRLPQSLCRFRYQYDMVEIGPEDLKFSEREAEHFFKKVIPLDLTRKQIRELNRYAGGWVAGFQIFGLSLKGKKTVTKPEKMLKAASKEAIDYLINEVISVQSEKVKTFLYQTAVLNRFNEKVCRFITGLPDAGKIISDLHRRNLFLIPLDPEQQWFRYHQLFSEAVREWVKIRSSDMLKKSRQKAALWFGKNDYLEEAFFYAFSSDDDEFTANLLEDYLIQLFEKYEVASSLRWLSKLPRDVFLKRPLLRLFECAFKINTMQLVDVAGVLPEIESRQYHIIEKYPAPKKALCVDLLVYLKTVLAYYRDILNVDVEKMNQDIGMISDNNRPLAGFIKILISGNYIYRGELTAAEKQMKAASADIFPSESVLAKISWTVVMATVRRLQGRMAQAEKLLQDALEFLSRRKLYDTPIKFILYLPMAWIFYQRNKLDKALEYGKLSLRYIERAGQIDSILQTYYLLSRIHMAKGDPKTALLFASKLKTLSKSLDYPSLSDYTDALASFLSISRGETDVLKKRPALKKPDMSEPFSFHFLAETMTVAVLLLFKGKPSDSCCMLEALKKRCKNRNMMEMILEIDVLLSGVYFLMGDKKQASTIMEKAVLFAEKEGYIRPFVNYAPLIVPLLRDLAKNSKRLERSPHFGTLVDVCEARIEDSSEVSSTSSTKNIFDLTERELEILRLMSDGYKNKQIADMTFISINTVKTHTQHIFKKLGVKSRLQALNKTKDLLQTVKQKSS